MSTGAIRRGYCSIHSEIEVDSELVVQDFLVDGIEIEVEGVSQQLHIVVERGVEQGRVVGVDGDGDSGGMERRQGMVGYKSFYPPA
jgi:hypothetical protein